MKHDIERYTPSQRSNHWAVAILFVLAALSGLALFHPALFGLSGLFGGGTWTRILHPFIGVAMFVFFLVLAIRFAGHNRIEARDRQWLRQINDVVHNREEKLPPVGRYNAGQKLLYWTLVLSMLVLLFSGIVIWREYFSSFFGITTLRLAAVLHALAAFVLIVSIIVHIYAAIWIKGSMGAMLYGTVSRAWARKHHPLWAKEVERK
ncbi:MULTISPECIES: formate dehydrogenase subunit gamma [Stutzerimonas]|jgi:formate dehydrogenase subunit gamma|uniref:Formate dehydrogenase n=2 Tax=Stutzerimonas balearica TaxID=74829 RepID=A0A8D3XXU3_9GAMM|nr:formate dehydrogenase subunit gamma [Stutzerimonas balearica]KIL03506.1 formate dehydrogenase [Stutzerimonas stutzeri]MBB62644.1 formate dehydrogenase subunit gamma [Pseudomonas sp.]MBZ5754487.1 formate dehydrogenase subunit gamma [Pseudomonas sp. S5(2021)]WIX02997.1 formate dehydrogenase subunit gamma [Pseudomonas sp. AR5]AJE13609.1 formate dehydrogenase [Stutzerimonas balearica DSM 6083]